MPSINHEGPIEVIRKQPRIAAVLAKCAGIPIPDGAEVTLGSNDASNVVPAEFTADSVAMIRDKVTGKPLLLVVIEPQGRMVEEKEFAWPAYLANLRAAHRCKSAVLIVVCWDEAEAEKCRQAIHMGHPNYILIPIVIGPRSAPSPEDPWLTIFCGAIGAIDLETDNGCTTVINAIVATDSNETDSRTLLGIIMGRASVDARRKLEELILTTTEFKVDFIDRAVEQASTVAKATGKAEGKAESLVIVLQARGFQLSSEQSETVRSCTDVSQLDLWLNRAGTASSADDVFKD